MSLIVIRNAVLNVLGTMLPMFVGVAAVPLLLRNLGESRLGVFTLALGLIGFSSIFDLGLGRALTQTVATELGRGAKLTRITKIFWRILPVIFLIGSGWAIALWLGAERLIYDAFQLNNALADESILGIRWIAISIPLTLCSIAVVGVLEGMQCFGVVNAIRVPIGIFTFVAPVVVSFWSNHVGYSIAALIAIRLLGTLAWFWVLALKIDLWRADCEPIETRSTWRFTGWLTISSIVGPLMVNADRFYLATLFSPAVIASYTVPLDTFLRAMALPLAAINVLFPAFARVGASNPQSAHLARLASWSILLCWGLPICLAVPFLKWLLTLWTSADFAEQIHPIAICLLLGVIINGFAQIPFALLQSSGRSDITAKLHIVELPVYFLLVINLVQIYGVLGAAIAWTIRVVFDTALLFTLTRIQFSAQKAVIKESVLHLLFSSFLFIAISYFFTMPN